MKILVERGDREGTLPGVDGSRTLEDSSFVCAEAVVDQGQ